MSPGKVAKWTGLSLLMLVLLIIVLVVGTVAYLGGTQSGTRQLLDLGKRFAPGELSVAQVEGALLDELTLQSLTYEQEDGLRVAIPRLYLNWEPSALLSLTAHVISLEVDQPTLVLPYTEPEEEPVDATPLFPISLPNVSLPVQLAIDNATITGVTLQPTLADGSPGVVQTIDNLRLKTHTEGNQLIIDQLAISAPQGKAEIAGDITPTDAYPLDLSVNWSVNLPDKSPLVGEGKLTGNTDALELTQQLSGLLKAKLVLTLNDVLQAPTGTLTLDQLLVDLGVAAPDFAGQTVSGSAEIGFDMEQVTVTSLAFTQDQSKGTVTLSGDVSHIQEQPTFDLNGVWKGLRYPLTGDTLLAGSEQGTLSVTGPLDGYTIAMSTQLNGDAIPAGQWQLNAQGSTERFKQFSLTGNTLEGELAVTGNAQWVPQVKWQVALTGKGINPGAQWPEWPGKLTTELTSQGQISTAGVLSLTADIKQLTGSMREQSVGGQGKVALNGDVVNIEQLRLSMAGAELTTSGRLANNLDLSWALKAPKLADILPNAQGSITGQGTVKGTQTAPVIIGNIAGDTLQFSTNRIAKLEADVNVNLGAQQQSTLDLTATQVNLSGQQWSDITLKGQGTPEQHNLTLVTQEGEVDVSLALNGGWKAPQWAGSLTQLDITNELAGKWQLGNPVAITGSAEQASASQLCLNRQPTGSGAACVQGSWSTKSGAKGAATLKEISLALLEPFMPAGTVTKGVLQASSDFSLPPGKNPVFDVSATVLQGGVSLEDQDLNISTGDVLVSVIGEKETLTANLQIPVLQPAGSITAKMTVNDLYNQGILAGSFNAQLSDLKFISLFSPQVQAVKGQVQSELTISGNLSQPKVLGYMELQNASAELPALGIVMDPIKLNIKDREGSDTLDITGALTSGEGTIDIAGNYNPLAGAGELTLAGKRFLAMGTKEIQVWISPDLQVGLDPDLIKVRGELTIPEANITPPKSSGVNSTSVSSDVVVVQDESELNEVAAGPAIDAAVRLTLGDKVNVDAFGFSGRLLGSILIEDDGRQATRATGNMDVAAGEYTLYGQDLTIERGSVVFTGGPVDNPGLDLRVSRTIDSDDVTVGAQVSGTINSPRFTLYSSPSLPESSKLSYLMFGRAPGTGSSSEQALLYRAAAALAMKGGNSIAENLNETLKLDDFGLEGDSANETSLFIGKYLSPRLYIKYGVGLLEPSSTFFLRYKLSSKWDFESETGTSGSGGDVIYTYEK
jgi:translocation and assembly module TamB